MSLATPWTREQFRDAVRRELMDPNARWWSNAELNTYIDQWQQRLQDQCEFAIGTATLTTSDSSIGLSDFASDILKPRALYWNGRRLPSRSKQDMDNLEIGWREHAPGNPYLTWQDTPQTINLWPTPSATGTGVLTYVRVGTFGDNDQSSIVPSWTRYSAIPFVAYRALSRYSPNTDINRALRYKVQFEQYLATITQIKDGFFPERHPTLRPGGQYEFNIILPRPLGDVSMPTVIALRQNDEVPTGAVNGTNTTFTLTHEPDPEISLLLFMDGVLMTQDTHYTLSGSTITFVPPYQPSTGQALFASYRYTS